MAIWHEDVLEWERVRGGEMDMEEKKKPLVITIMMEKGGVGKTTTCCNLAVLLGQRGKKVLVIDLDPQGNSTRTLTQRSTATRAADDKEGKRQDLGVKMAMEKLLTAFKEKTLDQVSISQYIEAAGYYKEDGEGRFIAYPNVTILPSSNGCELIEELFRYQARSTAHTTLALFAAAIDAIASNTDADIILVDTPPTRGFISQHCCFAADALLYTLNATQYSLDALMSSTRLKGAVEGEKGQEIPTLGIVLTMMERNKLCEFVLDDLRNAKTWSSLVFDTSIRKSVSVREAESFSQPVVIYAPRSTASEDYGTLCAEIETRIKNLRGATGNGC